MLIKEDLNPLPLVSIVATLIVLSYHSADTEWSSHTCKRKRICQLVTEDNIYCQALLFLAARVVAYLYGLILIYFCIVNETNCTNEDTRQDIYGRVQLILPTIDNRTY